MNERSFIVKSLSAVFRQQSPRRLKVGCQLAFLQDADLIPTLPDDATGAAPEAPALVHQAAPDWAAKQTARAKESRSDPKARKSQFP